MEQEKDFFERQKNDWKAHLFRKPAHRWWALAGLLGSLGMIYSGLSDDLWTVPAALPAPGVIEGMGLLFGCLAEVMPEEQTTLAGILRVWAGLFVVCGFALMVVGGFGPGP